VVAGSKAAVCSSPTESGGRCRFLLGGLIALLVAFPFVEALASPLVLLIPLAAVFLAAVVVAGSTPVHLRRAVVFAALQVGFTLLSLAQPKGDPSYKILVSFALAATVASILFSISCVLRYVLRARTITRDQIYAGICMYIMLGFAFGSIFYLTNILDPNSFASNVERTGGIPDLIYFSFVTLATLGYGDITPKTPAARSLTVVEALVGMVYLAVFMARLVSQRANDNSAE
jgi:hypothetical protein